MIHMLERTSPSGAWAELDPGRSLWDLVERSLTDRPRAVLAVDDLGREVTFGRFAAWCLRTEARLRERGVRERDVVSWQLPTWIESMVVAAALDRMGAVQNPLLPPWRRREVAFVTAQAGARWYLHPGVWRGRDYRELADQLVADQPGLHTVELGRGEPPDEGAPAPAVPPPAVPPTAEGDRVRWLFYTSGTTGEPKGVRHGHAAVVGATLSMCRGMRIGPGDRSLVAFPFTHIGGINWLMASLLTGCSLLVIESFADAGTMDLASRSDVTLAGVTTAFHLAYLEEQRRRPDRRLLPRVRAYPGGAAPKPPSLHHDLVREVGGVGIVSGFGLTEFPMVTMGSVLDPTEKLAHTEGRPSPGVEVKIAGPDGAPCPPGVDGEIRARGPHRMYGYVDATLDEAAFDEEGWFRTGDLGHIDPDGYLVVTGRLKDVIVRKGENISAQEVEHLLHGHAAVADVAVIGLPDAERGERVCAIVVPAPGTRPALDELVAHLRGEELMPQKLPEQLVLVDELPRNGAGKVRKDVLRAELG
jgi:cyclohexanecarboxylate-CoA ligase